MVLDMGSRRLTRHSMSTRGIQRELALLPCVSSLFTGIQRLAVPRALAGRAQQHEGIQSYLPPLTRS